MLFKNIKINIITVNLNIINNLIQLICKTEWILIIKILLLINKKEKLIDNK